MVLSAYRTKREIAATLLRDAIIRGELTPGTRILLEELSRKFGLSMTPIRESIPILEGEGFVVQLPHKGAVVAQMDREEIRELYAIRGAMEVLAISEGVPKLTGKDLTHMEALLATLEAFQGTMGDYLEVDRDFHLVLYQAAGVNVGLRLSRRSGSVASAICSSQCHPTNWRMLFRPITGNS